MSTPRELLWLACRQKTCCHTTKVVVTGLDVWRICQALSVQPWDFTVYCLADEAAPDSFGLVEGGPRYQVALAKRGRVGSRGAPCTFLWRLADGHAQCGLGSLRPSVCRAYPGVLVDDVLAADGSFCTCRRWSALDLDPQEDRALLEAVLREAAEYAAIVDGWNDALAGVADGRTYREFCTYVMDEYRRLEPA
jgi:hypothetical protein